MKYFSWVTKEKKNDKNAPYRSVTRAFAECCRIWAPSQPKALLSLLKHSCQDSPSQAGKLCRETEGNAVEPPKHHENKNVLEVRKSGCSAPAAHLPPADFWGSPKGPSNPPGGKKYTYPLPVYIYSLKIHIFPTNTYIPCLKNYIYPSQKWNEYVSFKGTNLTMTRHDQHHGFDLKVHF